MTSTLGNPNDILNESLTDAKLKEAAEWGVKCGVNHTLYVLTESEVEKLDSAPSLVVIKLNPYSKLNYGGEIAVDYEGKKIVSPEVPIELL